MKKRKHKQKPGQIQQAPTPIKEPEIVEEPEVVQQQRYEVMWVVYHTILCVGVWAIFFCTLWGVFFGWGTRL